MAADTDFMKMPGYEFWIESGGERAKQYQTQATNESGSIVLSCYIASKVGREFRIGARRLKHDQPVAVDFYLNDDCVYKRLMRANSNMPFDEFVSHVVTQNEQRRFAFATISYEEDEHAKLRSVPKNLGTIRVEIFRVTNIREVLYQQRPSFQVDTLNMSTLSEKAKTVSSHTISLSKPEPIVGNVTLGLCDYIDSSKTPWYTIKFLYRPLDILQAEGIAPLPLPKQTASSDGPPSRVMAERNMNRQQPSSGSDFTEDRKSIIKTIKSEGSRVNAQKVVGLEKPIVIEDSDEEDSKHLLKEKIKTEKRSRESSDGQGERKKRVKNTSDDPVIVIDSD